MTHRLGLLLTVIALLASVAFAHGDKKHVMGTLEKINADSVIVKQADGKSVEVKLVAGTMYVTRDGKAAKPSDLAVGDRVVIRHAVRRRSKVFHSGRGRSFFAEIVGARSVSSGPKRRSPSALRKQTNR
jgi:hypothetical protein